MQVKQAQNANGNDQITEAFRNSDVKSLEAIALLLLREVDLLKRKQFSIDDEVMTEKIHLHEEVAKFEINLICEALIRAKGKQTEAAELLGIKLTTLNVKIKRFKINIDALLADSQ
ncbi:MAG: helix-turn-helix domain-containing protein [Pyrinomonadaceae bacterium]